VKHILLYLLLSFIIVQSVQSQNQDSVNNISNDSLAKPDSILHTDPLQVITFPDSVYKKPVTSSGWKIIPGSSLQKLTYEILQHHPYFGFSATPQIVRSDNKIFEGKEILFYGLILIVIIYALLRRAFPKYFNDLFQLFFRTTLKQRQIKEQLMQTPFPSLLLNIFFIITGALYVNFLLSHYNLELFDNFWLTFVYCAFGLSAAYFIKFLGLKISGWLFNMQEAADSYLFIVFIINKMIGIFLLPFLFFMAFTRGDIYEVALMFSWFIIAALLFYRVLLTYNIVRNQIKVNPFHFFLYFCAFEIAPLLVVYKGLLLYFRISA
jgi:hypothetical protein